MKVYIVKYQTRRKGNVSMRQGDWQDREMCVVAGENAISAWAEVIMSLRGVDYHLTSITVDRQVDLIAG
jgi:hypothetical protein